MDRARNMVVRLQERFSEFVPISLQCCRREQTTAMGKIIITFPVVLLFGAADRNYRQVSREIHKLGSVRRIFAKGPSPVAQQIEKRSHGGRSIRPMAVDVAGLLDSPPTIKNIASDQLHVF